jgi:hypothetical protein
MSEFSKLLKSSKFATLAKPLKKVKNPIHPTHQVVETTRAALDRQEWGLKYALPSKVKSRYITFDNVDSQERLVDFETNGGDLWKRLRFQELGLVPKLEKDNENPANDNPLFQKKKSGSHGATATFDTVLEVDPNESKLELDSLVSTLSGLRTEFREYLLARDPKKLSEKKFNADDFRREGLRFLREHKKKQNINTLKSLKLSQTHKIHGFGGLSYNLKGRLATEPNGFVQHSVAPGRFLTGTNVAVGGFISRVNKTGSSQWTKVNSDGEGRETIVPLRPQQAVVRPTGSVSIEFDAISRPSKSNLRRPRQSQSKHDGFGEKAIGILNL